MLPTMLKARDIDRLTQGTVSMCFIWAGKVKKEVGEGNYT